MTRQQILDAVNARIRNREVRLVNERGDGVLLTAFAGTSLDFPRVYVDGMSCEISWYLAERIATGQTDQVLS